jgi:hypothetical protein
MRLKSLFFLVSLLCAHQLGYAQTLAQRRAEIDAKRSGVSYDSRDALPRGREFKRIDSTYYVGWMLEGTYKYDHAADYLGFRTASTQLEQAVRLMEKDFKKDLKTRTTDVFEFIRILKIHRDWDYVVYALMNCYSNTDDVPKLWALLQKCKTYNLQDEQYLDSYHYLAWTVHRNRFHTSKKYSFLKNSIQENETLANAYLDSSIIKIKRDAALNKAFLTIDYEASKMPGVWHYKSMLYSYQLNIPSAAHYYEKLKKTPFFPHNNYATFCSIQGNFAEATTEYDIAKTEDVNDKRMKESFYYLSIMNAYRAKPKEGIEELKALIKANGSTPGFGWYSMALCRDLLYDAQLTAARRYMDQAAAFKEIHIGTTLGSSHYDFTAALLKIILIQREIDQIKYLNTGWWYTPKELMRIGQKTTDKYSLQFLVINQLANNPERDRVIYKLFSTESTVSFDEVWELIEGFSTNFFLEKFKTEMKVDSRKKIKRYYALLLAKLYMKKEEYTTALTYLEGIFKETNIDATFEQLFLVRVHEAMITCRQKTKSVQSTAASVQYIMHHYPQLVPYSDIEMPLRVTSNASSAVQKDIVSCFNQARLNTKPAPNQPALHVHISFGKKGSLDVIELSSAYAGKEVAPKIVFSYSALRVKEIKQKLPLYIFGAGDEELQVNTGKEKK